MRCYICREFHHPDRCPSRCPSCLRRKPGTQGTGPSCQCDAVRRPRQIPGRVRRTYLNLEVAVGM